MNEKDLETSIEDLLGKLLEDDDTKANRKSKDSVFTDMFNEPEYTLKLYRALHPDDTETTEKDISVITLDSQLLNQQYNDLGFVVGKRLIILVEAQSTWSENIVVRVLLYVAWTWYKYIKQNELDIYDENKIELPEPELYVIFTGGGSKPEKVSLSESFFGGKNICIDCEVKASTSDSAMCLTSR